MDHHINREVRDPYLPDHEAIVARGATSKRVIIIAPTRAACETIELALTLEIETVLQKKHGSEIQELAKNGLGFGIVAGTGTGKTLSVRPIAQTILRTKDLRVGVINREREATPDTPNWNVVIVTTGIARRWFQDNDILPSDTLVVDEIHQTSAELELCLALGKRVGCTFIWLSATVDPTFYSGYLNSAAVIQSSAFDPKKAARVKVVHKGAQMFLDEKFLKTVEKERRGLAMFMPTRAGVEECADMVRYRAPRINSAFYHGGEPIRVIRPFLDGTAQRPFFLAMTSAGQSALNIQGLDTVIIDDTRFTNIIEGGKNVLTKLHLGANEILQMAGRVHGRVDGGRVFILSDRRIDFESLKPTAPEFQLSGDSERVALTCAALGVRADELDLPVPLDKRAYRDALVLLAGRGVIDDGKLTRYGRAVEALPVERAWAELIVNADDELVPYLAVMSSIESLHRMTREERNLEGLIVPGSDHLTAYNIYAEALKECGSIGQVYGLARHQFDETIADWAEARGVLVKSIEDTALGMASIYRSLNMPLPATLPQARSKIYVQFTDLVAKLMPFDFVIDEQTADGINARVSKTSVCGNWGVVAGDIRYFAGRNGEPRAGIEGTQIPFDAVRKYSTRTKPRVKYDPDRKHDQLVLSSRVEYFGFDLDREVQPIREFPAEYREEIYRVLAEALANGSARHLSVKKNRAEIDAIREVYRRSGGITPRLGFKELTELYLAQMRGDEGSVGHGINSIDDFRNARFEINISNFVSVEQRELYGRLPSVVLIRDKEAWIEYDVEEREDGSLFGIARLRIPEKIARNVISEEIPQLDRPLRFSVNRGQRGSVRADTLEELQELLDRPWSPAEIESDSPYASERSERSHRSRRSQRSQGPNRSGSSSGRSRRSERVRSSDGSGSDERKRVRAGRSDRKPFPGKPKGRNSQRRRPR